MSTIEEFIKIRKSIEALAIQITSCLEGNAIQDSRQHLDEANRQLEVLKPMVANDVQVIVVGRLTRQLAGLGVKIETMATKSPARKRSTAKSPTERSGKRSTATKLTGAKPKASIDPDGGEAPEIVIYERP
jgi:hypothetical protein